jgi:SPIRAL1-like protein
VFGARVAKGSNAYATGANQNCGNCITDRPTTRVHAAPGGKSSITLG